MPKKKVAVTGSHGLIGSALCEYLESKGYIVLRMVRRHGVHDTVYWDPAKDFVEEEKLHGIDALVHLAGEPILGRWTEEKKHHIQESRDEGTQLLSNVLASLHKKPKAFVCASAVGFYGDRAHHVITEKDPKGEGFLSDVCASWEDATTPAKESGIRVVNLRFGVILAKEGGALPKMLRPFKLGLGGTMGTGEQYMSWISIEDTVAAIEHTIKKATLHGPVNITAPHPVMNKEFVAALGEVLHRPTIMSMPAAAVAMLMGEAAHETVLASQRAEPQKLLKSGFKFKHPHLKDALLSILD